MKSILRINSTGKLIYYSYVERSFVEVVGIAEFTEEVETLSIEKFLFNTIWLYEIL